jgi:uncharacterized delta-60 repeat protein
VRYNSNGSLDTSFNGTGRVATNFGSFEFARSIALQNDGKILLGGYTGSGSDTSMAFARYNSDGTLDATFNGTGLRTLNLTDQGDEIFDLRMQPDGKILATGISFTSLIVLRLNIDGSLDTSFNGTGSVTSSNSTGTSLALQPDGKIVVGGFGSPSGGFDDFVAMRFNANGTPDSSFGGTGKVLTPVSASSQDRAFGVALQTDGKIVLAGNARDGRDKFAAVRYNANGSLDTSFNGTGKVITALGLQQDLALDMALQSDGRILVAGTSYNTDILSTDFALVCYNTDGTLDASFDGDGKVATHIESSDQGTALALQPDGRILVGGDLRIGATGDFADFAVLRYLGAPTVPEPGTNLLMASAGILLLGRRRPFRKGNHFRRT